MVPENVRGHYARTVTLWVDVPKEQRVTAKDLEEVLLKDQALSYGYFSPRRYRPYRIETRLLRIKDPTDGCRAAVKIIVKRRTRFAPCSSGMGNSPSDYFCKQHRYGDESRFRASSSWKRLSFQSPIKSIKIQSPLRWRHV